MSKLTAGVGWITCLLLTMPSLAQDTVRIQDVPGLGNFLARTAKANGLCEKHGIQCELRVIPSAPLGVQALLSGDIQVALAPGEVLVQAAARGADLKVIGSGVREPVFFLMAGASMETPSAAKGYPALMRDFKGKKVGVTARGSGAEFQLLEMLKDADMKPEEVTIVPVGAPDTAFPAIVNKQIDGLMLFMPMDGLCEVSKACRVVVDPRKGQGPADVVKTSGAAGVQLVRGDWAAKNPKTVEALGRVMREAEALVQNSANFASMMKIARDTFPLKMQESDRVLEISFRNTLPGYRWAVNPKALQHTADYMLRSGRVDKQVDTARLLLAP